MHIRISLHTRNRARSRVRTRLKTKVESRKDFTIPRAENHGRYIQIRFFSPISPRGARRRVSSLSLENLLLLFLLPPPPPPPHPIKALRETLLQALPFLLCILKGFTFPYMFLDPQLYLSLQGHSACETRMSWRFIPHTSFLSFPAMMTRLFPILPSNHLFL